MATALRFHVGGRAARARCPGRLAPLVIAIRYADVGRRIYEKPLCANRSIRRRRSETLSIDERATTRKESRGKGKRGGWGGAGQWEGEGRRKEGREGVRVMVVDWRRRAMCIVKTRAVGCRRGDRPTDRLDDILTHSDGWSRLQSVTTSAAAVSSSSSSSTSSVILSAAAVSAVRRIAVAVAAPAAAATQRRLCHQPPYCRLDNRPVVKTTTTLVAITTQVSYFRSLVCFVT